MQQVLRPFGFRLVRGAVRAGLQMGGEIGEIRRVEARIEIYEGFVLGAGSHGLASFDARVDQLVLQERRTFTTGQKTCYGSRRPWNRSIPQAGE